MKEGEKRNPAEVGYEWHVENGKSGWKSVASLRC